MSTDEEEVDILGLGGGDDRLPGLSRPHEELDRDPGAAATRHEGLRGGLAPLSHLIDASTERATRQRQLARIDDAHDEESGGIPCREVEGPVGRQDARRAEVGREEDAPDGEWHRIVRRGMGREGHAG